MVDTQSAFEFDLPSLLSCEGGDEEASHRLSGQHGMAPGTPLRIGLDDAEILSRSPPPQERRADDTGEKADRGLRS